MRQSISSRIKNGVKKSLNKFGITISKVRPIEDFYTDIKEKEFWEIYHQCKPFTMTTIDRMYSLYKTVNYIVDHNIKGCFVECGVWRGGSAMVIAKVLKNRGIEDRKIYLYDTYEGMTPPTKHDITMKGENASQMMEESLDDIEDSVWCFASLEDVKRNLNTTAYSQDNIIYIKGKVEDTLPNSIPNQEIALLRLDTDWYESTKHELQVLYPMLVENGVLIIDDYGYWQGCRKAVDEYFTENKFPVLMNRVDHSCRLIVK